MEDSILEDAIESQEKGQLCQLPIARIKKIMKADKDVHQCSHEAVFIAACAAELFIEQLVTESFERSKRDKRKSVFYKDVANCVSEFDQFEFLKDIIPHTVSLQKALLEQKKSTDTQNHGIPEKEKSPVESLSEVHENEMNES